MRWEVVVGLCDGGVGFGGCSGVGEWSGAPFPGMVFGRTEKEEMISTVSRRAAKENEDFSCFGLKGKTQAFSFVSRQRRIKKATMETFRGAAKCNWLTKITTFTYITCIRIEITIIVHTREDDPNVSLVLDKYN